MFLGNSSTPPAKAGLTLAIVATTASDRNMVANVVNFSSLGAGRWTVGTLSSLELTGDYRAIRTLEVIHFWNA
ncbi:hypothetical protein MPL1032_30337 [Mesorhizobium plurifarium]|uniref:Uncharacterized protein n=1 Tax=Mesorhizobium plurifarium TaxID=69974 RepID=A0A0K2W3D6_MESPL|nr:hypothetical protein MPL1032_30337 [Mesorhizobium plurifarium]